MKGLVTNVPQSIRNKVETDWLQRLEFKQNTNIIIIMIFNIIMIVEKH